MSGLTELGHRQELLKEEISRLSQHPAHIHHMTEDERAARLSGLNGELELVRREIEQAVQAQQARHISRVLGTPYGVPASEDAKAELAKAEADLAKTLESFTSQTRGYARKVRGAQLRVFEAAGNASQPTRRPDMVLSGLAQRLAAMVERTVKHGR